MKERTIEECIAVIDEIVGRCVRDAEYGARVLDHPEATLAEYEPDEDILNDFRVLAQNRDATLDIWTGMRRLMSAQ